MQAAFLWVVVYLFACVLPSHGEEGFSVTNHSEVQFRGLSSLSLPSPGRHVFMLGGGGVGGDHETRTALLPASVSPCAEQTVNPSASSL